MKGYHYTTLKNYDKIKVDGLEPAPFTEKDTFKESKDKGGVWLFYEPQEKEQLFGVLVDCFARHEQQWMMVELQIDFEIKDHIQGFKAGDELKVTYTAAIGSWTYHNDTLILVVGVRVPPDQIRLCRVFDLYPRSR